MYSDMRFGLRRGGENVRPSSAWQIFERMGCVGDGFILNGLMGGFFSLLSVLIRIPIFKWAVLMFST